MPTIFQTLDRHGEPHRNWRFKYIDYQGNRKTATGLPTKEATKKLANKIQTEQDEIRKGLRPPPKESDRPRSFQAVVEEYLAWGASQGGHGGRPWSEAHYSRREYHLKYWQERLALEVLSDVDGILPQVEAALRELQAAGRGGKTLQNYAETIAAICDWAIKREYLEKDPLKNLQKFDTTTRHPRRAPTVEEIHAILAVAPPARRIVYELALVSGLRANELRSLRVRHLDTQHHGLRLEAGWTKGRKATFQPVHPALIAKLAVSAANKQPNDQLLAVPVHAAEALYRDMKKAGVPRMTAEGKFDFHALRTGYTTLLFESGANVKEAQTLARHSTPDLTVNVYARTRSDRLADVAHAVGDRVLALARCPTGVQQLAIDGLPPAPTNDSAKDCSGGAAVTGEGSNPPAASIVAAAMVGQNLPQPGLIPALFGLCDQVGHSPLVETRTPPATAADSFGQRECTTDVQRTLAASGVFGFSIDDAVTVFGNNFSGFSGATMRSA